MSNTNYIRYLIFLSFLFRFGYASTDLYVPAAADQKKAGLNAFTDKKVSKNYIYKIKNARNFNKRKNKCREAAFLKITHARAHQRIVYFNRSIIKSQEIFTKQASYFFLKRGPPAV